MIYLIDDPTLTIPNDSTRVVYIGEGTMENAEQLKPEEQSMFSMGARVQFWHARNNFVPFLLLTRNRSQYGKYVSDRHFD